MRVVNRRGRSLTARPIVNSLVVNGTVNLCLFFVLGGN